MDKEKEYLLVLIELYSKIVDSDCEQVIDSDAFINAGCVINGAGYAWLNHVEADILLDAVAKLEKRNGGSVEFRSGYSTALSNLRQHAKELKGE